jgi:phosphatidylethanolamine/phosphatidyl-N-methylethanolamine N-methyltransferase
MTTPLQEKFYREYYPELVNGGASGGYHALTHRLLERGFTESDSFSDVLEVGSGEGEHLPFVRHAFTSYCMSDIRPPRASIEDPRVTFIQADVQSLPVADAVYDRVISTCLLHHVENPVHTLEEMRRVARPGGVVSIMIAADPGLAYRLAQGVSSGRQYRKMGFGDWRALHAMEHRNHAGSLHHLINYVFRGDAVSGRGFPFAPASWWNLNLLAVYQIRLSTDIA